MSAIDSPTIVQLVLINETGDSYYRMRWPGRTLAEQKPNWRIISLDSRAEERFLWAEKADLLVLYQSGDSDLLPLIHKRKQLGKKTIVEYNDNFYAPPSSSPVAKEWASPLLWQNYERFMKAADAVVVTGRELHDVFSEKVDTPIYILENHFPFVLPSFDTVWKKVDDRIILGWAGSVGHMGDFLWILPVIREIVLSNPNVHFHAMGNDSITQLARLPKEKFKFTPWGTMEQYFSFWRGVHLGIGPLVDTAYNRCRSDIKAIEMSAATACPILSPLKPYEGFLKATKLKTFSNARELRSHLLCYIASPGEIREDAETAFRYVEEHRIAAKRTERAQLFEQLLPTKSESSDWPVGPGYHELTGKAEEKPRFFTTLAKAQALLKDKQTDQAAELLRSAVTSNPGNPEYALMFIHSLAATRSPEAAEQLKQSLLHFPEDLRFVTLQVRLQSDKREREHLLRLLRERLREFSPVYLRYFLPEIEVLLVEQVRETSALASVVEEFIEYLPDSAALRFELAEAWERLGENTKAQVHFDKLLQQKQVFDANNKFLANVHENYLSTWTGALSARSKN